MDFDIVFLKPEKFEDTRKIVEHIKKDRIVHINISKLDTKDRQRTLDFISGAAYIQDARLIQPGDAVFCTIPSGKDYFQEGSVAADDSELIDLRYDEEEEIKPSFN